MQLYSTMHFCVLTRICSNTIKSSVNMNKDDFKSSQESRRSWMFLLRVSILPLSTILIFYFGIVSTVWYMCILGFTLIKRKEFEEGLIRIRQSKNDQQKKDKRANNDLQNTIQRTKDRATQTPLKTIGELWCSGMVSSFCSTGGTCSVTPVIILYWWHMYCYSSYYALLVAHVLLL